MKDIAFIHLGFVCMLLYIYCLYINKNMEDDSTIKFQLIIKDIFVSWMIYFNHISHFLSVLNVCVVKFYHNTSHVISSYALICIWRKNIFE